MCYNEIVKGDDVVEKKMTNRQIAALETRRKLLEAAKKLICEKAW